MKQPDQQETAAWYQLLFDHMYNEHGLTLTQSDMDDIIGVVKETLNQENIL